ATGPELRIGRHPLLALPAELDVGEIAVDLVGASEEQRRRCGQRPKRLEQVQRAARVRIEVLAWTVEAGGHRNLGGEMEHRLRPRQPVAPEIRIPDVRDLQLDALAMAGEQPFQILLDTGPLQPVHEQYGPSLPGEPVR